jgi:hypothetical protein
MASPRSIRCAEDFLATVEIGVTCESNVLDFKQKIETKKVDAALEICRDMAQFANTFGGCLLVGISELADPVSGLKVAGPIVPMTNADKQREWIEQQAANHLVPSTFTHEILPLSLSDGTILAVNIEPSRHLVTVWDRPKHTCQFVRRTSHGKEFMNPDEMERHLMDGSRAGKLALLQAHDRSKTENVRVAGDLWMRQGRGNIAERWRSKAIRLGRVEEHYFELLVNNGKGKDLPVIIPFDALRSAWPSPNAVNLLLEMRIVLVSDGNEVILEPPL